MKIYPRIGGLKGNLFFTKENTIEVVPGVMHQKMRPRENSPKYADDIPGLSFEFNGTNLYYDIKAKQLVDGIEDEVLYTNSINGHECHLEDFISQEFTLEGKIIVIVSFSIYVFEGVEYQKYLAQGIFLNNIEILKPYGIFGLN